MKGDPIPLNTKIEGTRLTPLKYVKMATNGNAIFLFECECGTIKEISLSHVKARRTRSCGCLQKEIRSQNLMNWSLLSEHRKNKIVPYQYKKGNIPWNKGLTGVQTNPMKGKTSPRKGKIRIEYPNGHEEWI